MSGHDLAAPSSLDATLRLVLAFLLGLPVGWERERRSHSAGLRTYPLLSVCVCGFLLLGSAEAPLEQADIFYGVLNGIGFVAFGALLKSPTHVSGMTTAVSLWVTGAIGAAVAYGSPLIAAALSLMSVLVPLAPPLVRRGSETS